MAIPAIPASAAFAAGFASKLPPQARPPPPSRCPSSPGCCWCSEWLVAPDKPLVVHLSVTAIQSGWVPYLGRAGPIGVRGGTRLHQDAIHHGESIRTWLAEIGIGDPDLSPVLALVLAYVHLGRAADVHEARSQFARPAYEKGQPWSLARAARCSTFWLTKHRSKAISSRR